MNSRLIFSAALLLFSTLPGFASHTRRGPTAGRHKSSKTHSSTHTRPRAMDDERATEIQTALVKAGYLPSVSGHWDSNSEAAMQKLQADNGWQTKLIPDSRALIKLGLGSDPDAASRATAAGPGAHTESQPAGGPSSQP